MKTFAIAAALSAAITAAAPAQAAELVTNGGFETGSFSGWTQFGNTGFTGVYDSNSGADPHSGTYFAAFGPVSSVGGIFQTLNTVAGQTYRITFSLANLGSAPNFAGISFGGVELDSITDFEPFPYQDLFADVVATSSQSELRFSFQHDSSYFLLDSVSVQGVAGGSVSGVPEPTSWAMMTLGFGGVGFALRRRRKVTTRVSFG